MIPTLRNRIARWRKRRAWRRALHALRVHSKIIRTTSDLENIRLCGLLEHAEFPAPRSALSHFVPRKYLNYSHICLRQKTLGANFLNLLAESSKHVVEPGTELTLPIPQRWRRHLLRHGLNVGRRAKIQFFISIIDALLRGLRTTRVLILAHQRGWHAQQPASKYHVFIRTNPNSLPDPNGTRERWNLHRWYKETYELSEDFPFVAQDQGLEMAETLGRNGAIAPMPFPPLAPTERRAFAIESIFLGLKAAMGLTTGFWWLSVMLEEAVTLAYVRRIPDEKLAVRYLFHMGDAMIRPLWTYDVEHRGSEVVTAFYSSNFIPFGRSRSGSDPRYPGYALMSWPKLICNDDFTRKTLVGYGLAENTVSVSRVPIDLLDNGAALPVVTNPMVILFDVTPYRPYFKATRGYHIAYYNVGTCIRFIEEIVDSAGKNGWTVALKTKRANNRFDAPTYATHIDRLVTKAGVTIIDAGVSASRAIEIADAVLSMPFSSPSVNADARGIPGAYYDPGGEVSHHKELARGLPIHTCTEALDAWFAMLNEKRNRKHSVG